MIIAPSLEKTLLKMFILCQEHLTVLTSIHSSNFSGNAFQQFLELNYNPVGVAPRVSSYGLNTFYRSISNPFIYSLCSDVFKGYENQESQTIAEIFCKCFEIILKVEKEYPEEFKENFTTEDNCQNILKFFKHYIQSHNKNELGSYLRDQVFQQTK